MHMCLNDYTAPSNGFTCGPNQNQGPVCLPEPSQLVVAAVFASRSPLRGSPHVLSIVPTPRIVAAIASVLVMVILLARLSIVAVRATVAIAASIVNVAAMVILVDLGIVHIVHLIMRMVSVLGFAL